MKTRRMARILLASLLFLPALPTPAFALKFSNSFTEFELPPKWTCVLDETWTCETGDDEKGHGDALMVLAAKKKGEQDTLEKYQAQMTKPRTVKDDSGKEHTSKVQYVKSTEINGTVWIDALHIDSEMPGYYTRYIATIKEDIGVLITYSIDKDKYKEYSPQLEALIRGIKVFRNKPAPPPAAPMAIQKPVNPSMSGMAVPSTFTGGKASAPVEPPKARSAAAQGGGGLLLLLILGGGGFYFYKKKKNAATS